MEKEIPRFFKSFLFFFFLNPSFFALASADICELLSFTCMTLIRRASPQTGRDLLAGGVSGAGFGKVVGKERGKLKREKHLRDLGKKEDGTISRAPWIYLAARDTAGRMPCLYQWHTRAVISNETICNLQKMHPKAQAKEYSQFEHSKRNSRYSSI